MKLHSGDFGRFFSAAGTVREMAFACIVPLFFSSAFRRWSENVPKRFPKGDHFGTRWTTRAPRFIHFCKKKLSKFFFVGANFFWVGNNYFSYRKSFFLKRSIHGEETSWQMGFVKVTFFAFYVNMSNIDASVLIEYSWYMRINFVRIKQLPDKIVSSIIFINQTYD